MTHPSPETLHAWIDREVEPDVARDLTAHVARCGACRAEADAVRGLGAGMRAWTEDNVPALEGDIAAWVFEKADAPAVAAVPARTAAKAPSAQTALEHARTRRRFIIGSAIAFPLLAAAAFLLVLNTRVTLNGLPLGLRHVRPLTDPILSRAETLFGRPTIKLAAELTPHGTQLVSIGGKRGGATYSVIELHNDTTGVTTSVVWINEQESDNDENQGAVQ